MELGALGSGPGVNRFAFTQPTERPEDRAQAQDRRNLIKAVKELEATPEFGVGLNQEMTFAFDRRSKRTVVKIVDHQTREVVRQFPSEEILRMAERLRSG